MRETDLYASVKAFLEQQGYTVKSEIGPCDVVARRGEDPPVIVELKLRVSLALIHQAIARQTLFDHVYIAVPESPAARSRDTHRLCRRLGLGLLTVAEGAVTAWLDPGPYAPRKRAAAATRLLREFDKRVGDPNLGGSRGPRMTAYRQAALRCAGHLAAQGPTPGRVVVSATGVVRATQIMRDDHYGWFERVARGVYALSPRGSAALTAYADPTPAGEVHAGTPGDTAIPAPHDRR
ncbi:MAG: DUF2161 family putative PD-(D/E)XK-type phosphodiesterase [Pseudomonadota bacterium]